MSFQADLGNTEDRMGKAPRELMAVVLTYTRMGTIGACCAAALLATLPGAGAAQQRGSTSHTVFTGKLPALDGQHLNTTIVEVTYPPGGTNPSHRHPCPVIGYVLEGAMRMQVKGQAERIVEAGETFAESPTDVHVASANASDDRPARFLAFFVCDRPTPLSVPVSDDAAEPR